MFFSNDIQTLRPPDTDNLFRLITLICLLVFMKRRITWFKSFSFTFLSTDFPVPVISADLFTQLVPNNSQEEAPVRYIMTVTVEFGATTKFYEIDFNFKTVSKTGLSISRSAVYIMLDSMLHQLVQNSSDTLMRFWLPEGRTIVITPSK